MKRAYVDASVVVGLHFHEPTARGLWRRLRTYGQLVSASLLVAEVRSALRRERRSLTEADSILQRIALFAPDGDLRAECEEALGRGVLRGADLWHVASALAIAGPRFRKTLGFITLDDGQAAVASELGFTVIPARGR